MSGSMASFDSMGMTNNHWGICGINSSLYALYQNNKTMRKRLARGAVTPTMMLAEIKIFLRTLQAEGKQNVLNEIESFTRSFTGFENFTVRTYIEKINDAAATVSGTGTGIGSHRVQGALLKDNFSIGLPPNAVIFYLQKICGFDRARLIDLGSRGTELVVGLYRNDGTNMSLYNGLRHYVYYRSGTYYSWGKQFSSISQMPNNYEGICYKIAF